MITKLDLLLPYENKWVALTPDNSKVVAYGNTYKEVDNLLKRKKIGDVVLSFILPFDTSYSPNGKKFH